MTAFLPLLVRLAFRNRARTLTTALGVAAALLGFLLLRTLVSSWYSVDNRAARTDRLIVRHKISITFPLYTSQVEKIRSVPGVQEVSWFCWSGGTYIDEKQVFDRRAVDVPSYFRIYPEYRFGPAQMQAWLADPAGAAAGDALAKKYGWKLGDHIAIKGTYYPGNWDFTLRAIYTGGDDIDHQAFFWHWNYLNTKLHAHEHVQRFVVKASDPKVARRIDALFANSDLPTKTESELSVTESWISWSSTLVHGIDVVSALMLVVLLLVFGNGMAMATRENLPEYASMRAIGYRARHITWLVLAQGSFVALLGIGAGLAATPPMLKLFSRLLEQEVGGAWELKLSWGITWFAVAVALATSLLASGLPAWRSGRLRIVDELRKVV